jgi:hypothetical protein
MSQDIVEIRRDSGVVASAENLFIVGDDTVFVYAAI